MCGNVGRSFIGARLALTQQQLGDKLGIEANQIENYETGANCISASVMRRIAEEMEVPVPFFFVGLARALSDPQRSSHDALEAN